PLWEYYKKEKTKKDTIKKIKEDRELNIGDGNTKDVSKGEAYESENYTIEKDTFVETELIKRRKEKLEEENKKIKELQLLLGIDEDQAKDFIRQSQKSSDSERLLRPDKFYFNTRKDLDDLIREVIIPELLVDYGLDVEGDELLQQKQILPRRDYSWIYSRVKNNGGLLGMYFNTYLR